MVYKSTGGGFKYFADFWLCWRCGPPPRLQMFSR